MVIKEEKVKQNTPAKLYHVYSNATFWCGVFGFGATTVGGIFFFNILNLNSWNTLDTSVGAGLVIVMLWLSAACVRTGYAETAADNVAAQKRTKRKFNFQSD